MLDKKKEDPMDVIKKMGENIEEDMKRLKVWSQMSTVFLACRKFGIKKEDVLHEINKYFPNK